MKKNFGSIVKISLLSVVFLFSSNGFMSAQGLDPKELKDSGATTFVRSRQDYIDLMELINENYGDWADFTKISQSSLLSMTAIAQSTSNKKETYRTETFLLKLAELQKCIKSGKPYDMAWGYDDFSDEYKQSIDLLKESLAEDGFDFDIQKCQYKINLSEKTGDVQNMEFFVNLIESFDMNCDEVEDLEEGPYTHGKIKMVLDGNWNIDLTADSADEFFKITFDGNSPDLLKSQDAFDKIVNLPNKLFMDYGANMDAGCSINVDGMGGKMIYHVYVGIDKTYIDEEFMKRVSAVQNIGVGMDADEMIETIMNFPLTMKGSVKFYDDNGNETFVVYEVDSLLELFGAMIQ